ncbi:hypothetical protein PIB30_080898 [Stylosanthes scabra]|uniref:Uncharacterized protein n=1 Tax=Stylosanthes scabra TaxID=79078 RepID=A0ABU6UQY3_9FABA|nr:hypothetical protein [Stylosanthes scabra]
MKRAETGRLSRKKARRSPQQIQKEIAPEADPSNPAHGVAGTQQSMKNQDFGNMGMEEVDAQVVEIIKTLNQTLSEDTSLDLE